MDATPNSTSLPFKLFGTRYGLADAIVRRSRCFRSLGQNPIQLINMYDGRRNRVLRAQRELKGCDDNEIANVDEMRRGTVRANDTAFGRSLDRVGSQAGAAHLQSGKPFKQMGGMRSREAVANWLLCAVVNYTGQRVLSFTSDPTGGDGVLEDARTGETVLTEHVMVPRQNGGEGADAHALVLDAINRKRAKGGEAYARGKTLVVFLDAAAGKWFPNRVAKALPDPLYFDDVWVVGLYVVENGEYVYGVTQLDLSSGNAPAYTVRITPHFTGWVVKEVQ